MKAKENEQASENSIIRAAVAEADAATAALIIDPREIVRAARARIAQTRFPTPDRARQAAHEIASSSKSIDELIRNGNDLNTIRRAVGDSEERCRRLAIPEKAASFEEEIARIEPLLRQASWMPEEIDGLKRLWGSGGRINAITVTSVKVGDREILRSEIRKTLGSSAAEDSRNREREALQLEAENKERRARGEEPRHRAW